MDVDPDLGVALYRNVPKSSSSSNTFTLPATADALDVAGAVALALLTAGSSSDAFVGDTKAGGGDDNDFDFEVITSAEVIASVNNADNAISESPALALLRAPPPKALSGAKVTSSSNTSYDVNDEIGTGAAMDAISAVRAAIAAEDAAVIARENAAAAARLLSLVKLVVEVDDGAAAGFRSRNHVGSSAVASLSIAEGDEDQEEDEAEEEKKKKGEEEEEDENGQRRRGGSLTSASPRGGAIPLTLPAEHLGEFNTRINMNSVAVVMTDVVQAAAKEDSVAAKVAAQEDLVAAFEAASGAVSAAKSIAASATTQTPKVWPSLAAVEGRLAGSDLIPFLAGITATAPDPTATCWSRLFAARLKASLEPAHRDVFALAKRPFDPNGPLQPELMAAIYERLSGKSSSAAGAAWTAIGFQRENDFTTDLRGVGMLGPYQVYSAIECHAGVVRRAWKIANDPMQGFPFMVQCFSLSAKVLHALRVGKLAHAVNVAKPQPTGNIVLRVCDDFFAALLLAFTHAWHADPQASIMRLGHIQLDVVTKAMAAPDALLSRLVEWEEKEEREGRPSRFDSQPIEVVVRREVSL